MKQLIFSLKGNACQPLTPNLSLILYPPGLSNPCHAMKKLVISLKGTTANH
jgi:hypothetical protein